MKLRILTVLLLLILQSASAVANQYGSRFLIGGSGYDLNNSASIVLVYTHGSRDDQKRDPCKFTIGRHYLDQYFGSFRIPRVLENIAESELQIAIFYVCHREIGDQEALFEETRKREPCQVTESNRLAKFCKRKRKIQLEVENIKNANPKLDSSNIILTGASSGAWSSMLLYRERPDFVGGVIAFAPATNGKLGREIKRARGKMQRKKRKCGPGSPIGETIPKVPSASRYFRHKCQQKYIADGIPSALVFSFEGDPFNPPELLTEFQKASSRIEFHTIARASCGIGLPGASHPHSCYQKRFFGREHVGAIKRYIAARVSQ